MSSDTLFSMSKPKHPEVTGAKDQVFVIENISDHITKAIKSGNVSALVTVNQDTELVYIVDPRLHCDLAGTPIEVVGNASDVQGEFTMIKAKLSTIGGSFPTFR